MVGCDCKVCTSSDPRDNRLRCSVLIQSEHTSLVIDIGPDFRQQMLRAKPERVDAILITHEHNDHVIGMDEVRPFNFKQKMELPVFAQDHVCKEIKGRFDYIFQESPYPGAPRLKLISLDPTQIFQLGDLSITPIPIQHGKIEILGFRVGDFTYITDAKIIPEASYDLIKGTETLVINALHHSEHHSHLNLEQSLKEIERINPTQAYLTHVSHYMGIAAEVNEKLPHNVQLAYDQMIIHANAESTTI